MPEIIDTVTICKGLLRKFDLEQLPLTSDALETLVEEAADRSSKRVSCIDCIDGGERGPCAHIQDERVQMVLCREFLKVVCGKAFLNETRAAVKQLRDESGGDSSVALDQYKKVQTMLSPKENSEEDPADYFDPRSWDVQSVDGATDSERLVRLALFVEGLLDQEEAFRAENVSIQKAADLAVQERKQFQLKKQ